MQGPILLLLQQQLSYCVYPSICWRMGIEECTGGTNSAQYHIHKCSNLPIEKATSPGDVSRHEMAQIHTNVIARTSTRVPKALAMAIKGRSVCMPMLNHRLD